MSIERPCDDRSSLQHGLELLTAAAHQHARPEAAHRRYQRFIVNADAMLMASSCPGGLSEQAPAVVRDISRVGAGVLCRVPLSQCDAVPLALRDGSLTLATIPTFVRFCSPIAGTDRVYLAGLEFGVEAGLLVSLGVAPLEILQGDQPEANAITHHGSFMTPEDLINLDQQTDAA